MWQIKLLVLSHLDNTRRFTVRCGVRKKFICKKFQCNIQGNFWYKQGFEYPFICRSSGKFSCPLLADYTHKGMKLQSMLARCYSVLLFPFLSAFRLLCLKWSYNGRLFSKKSDFLIKMIITSIYLYIYLYKLDSTGH